MAKDVNNMSSADFASSISPELHILNRLCALEATAVKLADCIEGLDKHYNEIIRKIVGYNRLKLECALCKTVHVLIDECPKLDEQITDSVTQ